MSETYQECSAIVSLLEQFKPNQNQTVCGPLYLLTNHQRAELASQKCPQVQIATCEEEAGPTQLRAGGVERGRVQRGRVLRSVWHPGRSEGTTALQ